MDNISFLRAPTLNAMREAMVSGLTARLIGEGAIDEDDEFGGECATTEAPPSPVIKEVCISGP